MSGNDRDHLLWRPAVLGETNSVLASKSNISQAGRDSVARAAVDILGRGQPPQGAAGSRTGLAVGYVQSGKTLSFTTVLALARDNSFPIVIVVAGTSNDLFAQTNSRLLEDLHVANSYGPPRWIHLRNPDEGARPLVQSVLDNWRDEENLPEDRATLLITVAKQHVRLGNLNTLLEHFDLHDVPIVVVDDEADQASLNARVNQGSETTTYQRLLDLRDRLPRHTFLQYTATPQAPLLINIIDVLSPEYVEVLEPGEGYVGGRDFFGGNRQYTRVIPPEQVPSRENPIDEPPETLLQALRVFFVGITAALIRTPWGEANQNRSMLVHPTRTTQEHFQYFQAILAVKEEWVRVLNLPVGDHDRTELEADFLAAYRDLQGTMGAELPELANIMQRLRRNIANVQVREVNRRVGNRARDFDWRQAYAWILVGGQAMDRGFTVKELTVTYMPRGIGTGNADTLQQRARFFGYKRQYLGSCRIYLEAQALASFEGYVEHEEAMREELARLQRNGRALRDWKRRFILSPDLQPCRSSVIQQDIVRGNYSDDWFYPKMLRMSPGAIAANRALFEGVQARFRFQADQRFTLPAQRHLICENAALIEVLDEVLLKYRIEDPLDTQNSIGFLLQVSQALKRAERRNEIELANLYVMRPDFQGSRGVENGKLGSARRLLQGKTKTARGENYPGDHVFIAPDRISVQLHVFNLTENGHPTIEQVPVLAVWIPARLEVDWVVQDQG